MKYSYKGMTIHVLEDYEKVSIKAAQLLAAQVTLNPRSVLGLATGSTPLRMYELLIEMYNHELIDFSEVTSFNLDEYYNLDKENEESYAYYMDKNFFDHININKENVNIPNGVVKDIEAYCEDYDAKIFNAGKIDFQVLGIGANGHIGFNEPDVHFEAGTHLVKLDEKTIKDNARFFDKIEDVPKEAISMGIRNIMQSKIVILMATGENKIGAVEKMIFGEVTPILPASILQVHNNVTILVDKVIGDKIKDRLI